MELSHLGLLHAQMRDDYPIVWDLSLDRLRETLGELDLGEGAAGDPDEF